MITKNSLTDKRIINTLESRAKDYNLLSSITQVKQDLDIKSYLKYMTKNEDEFNKYLNYYNILKEKR